MIKVISTHDKSIGTLRNYNSHVTIEGSRAEIACEIKALIHSFVDDPELEDIYLTVATEIAQDKVQDLERTLEDLKND